MEKDKQSSKAKRNKSSAALVSLILHGVLIVVAVFFVAMRTYVKEDQTFETAVVKRPRVKLKKLSVPVDVKKRKIEKPKLRKTIISKPKTTTVAMKMPEIVGVKGGTGYLRDGGGLGGSLGFGLDLDIFGGDKGSGNELEGTFFDLKLKPDGARRDMDSEAYKDAIRNFISSWNVSRFKSKYFMAPKKKFATTFMVPRISATAAPKAYGVEKVVKPKFWVAYYNGKIAAPETGRYRFWGAADDLLMVRVKGRLVLDGTRKGTVVSDWKSEDRRSGRYKISGEEIKIGDWFHLTKGKGVEMEVLLGERPGGLFNCTLLIEQQGVRYPKGNKGQPILPIFKTADIPKKLIPQMKIDKSACSPDGPTYGVMK